MSSTNVMGTELRNEVRSTASVTVDEQNCHSNGKNEIQPHNSDTTSTTTLSNDATQSGLDNMTKKKKLTAPEKQEAQALKEVEAQRKAEEKARKEEAKRLKDEERRQKQDDAKREREEKQKVKDAAKAERDAVKAEKDAEKRAREEAEAKKDKAQLRLGAFFKRPASDGNASEASSRRSSITSIDVDASQAIGVDADQVPRKVSDYEKTFVPFFLHAHTTLASKQTVILNQLQVQSAFQQISQGLNDPSYRPSTVLGKRKRCTSVLQPPVKKIMLELQSMDPNNPIDLDGNKFANASKALRDSRIKYLKFREDVRPPWIGTCSKAIGASKFAALCRNPFRRDLPHINYDYDSEAEWEEPEEGEDLNSEGEEDDEEEDEDMGEFLDDEAAEALPKRKQLVGDLEPIYTTLNWEKPGLRKHAITFGTTTLDMEQYRMGILSDTPITFPLDPFSTSYWVKETVTKSQPKLPLVDGNMQPPVRLPLTTLAGPNQQVVKTLGDLKGKVSKSSANAKPIPPELLADFKKAINGSNLSKIGLIEVLKKDFPSITKKTVEKTLLEVAQRIGKKESEKTWQLIESTVS